jgi:hypothetical protein
MKNESIEKLHPTILRKFIIILFSAIALGFPAVIIGLTHKESDPQLSNISYGIFVTLVIGALVSLAVLTKFVKCPKCNTKTRKVDHPTTHKVYCRPCNITWNLRIGKKNNHQ